MFLVSVPNYSIHRFNKDYYSVALTNGNIGAGLVHKNDFAKFVEEHNGKDYRKPAKKIAAGIAAVGLVTAGIVFRKPLKEVAVKAFNAVKDSPFIKRTAKFVQDSWNSTKTYAKDMTTELAKYVKLAAEKIQVKGKEIVSKMRAPKNA